MKSHFIVMGDILNSRLYNGQKLMSEFKQWISSCNRKFGTGILSPYTITLGDEFQGVAESLFWAVQTLLYLDESTWRTELSFTMRFVVHLGNIETPVNTGIAYGMMGSGLTHARELLDKKRWRRPYGSENLSNDVPRGSRFIFDLPDQKRAADLRRLFEVMASLKRNWKKKDADLIVHMMECDNNSLVGADSGKNRSQIWKRRRNLHVNDFMALKEIAIGLSQDQGDS